MKSFLTACCLMATLTPFPCAGADLRQQVVEANILTDAGRYVDAEARLQVLLPMARQPGVDRTVLLAALNAMATALHQQGRLIEAQKVFAEAVPLAERIPSLPRSELVRALANSGDNCFLLAQYDQAESILRRALTLADKEDLPLVLNNLAVVAMGRHRYTEAESLIRRALDGFIEQYGVRSADTARVQQNLAWLYDAQGRLPEAESLYRRVLATREALLGRAHPDVARVLLNLSAVDLSIGELPEAERYARRALAIAEGAQAEPVLAGALAGLANVLSAESKFAPAEPLYRRALALLETMYGSQHPQITSVLFNLGGMCLRQKRYAESVELLSRAATIREAAFGAGDPKVISTLELYALALRKAGSKDDAREIESRVKAFRK